MHALLIKILEIRYNDFGVQHLKKELSQMMMNAYLRAIFVLHFLKLYKVLVVNLSLRMIDV